MPTNRVKNMQTVKFKVWLIGAALSVAPIFYSVWYSPPVHAQSQQGASMVLEIQQLRAEIAELRDTLERQQYQIRQLQRASQQSAPQLGSSADQQPAVTGQLAATVPGAPIDVQQGAESVIGGMPQTVDGGSVAVTSTNPASAAANNPVGLGSGAVQNNETEFYRPNPAAEAGSVVAENPEVVSAARQAADTYPPVVDRSIGGTAAAANPQPAVQPPDPQSNARSTTLPATQSPVVDSAGVFSQTPPPPNIRSAEQAKPAAGPVVGTAVDTATVNNPAAGAGGVIRIPNTGQPSSAPATAPAVEQNANPVAAAQTPIPAVLSEQDYYQQGFDLLKQSRYSQAVDVFKQQISNYPDGSYADDAHYWVAESMYLNRNLPESKQYFRAIIDNFQQSPRLPDAMLKTAYIEQEQGNEIEARILLQEIIQYHPRSDAAISAKNRLEKLN